MSLSDVERVVSTRVSLICAGWLPQDGTLKTELTSGSSLERNLLHDKQIAHSGGADNSKTLADIVVAHLGNFRVVSPVGPPQTSTSRPVHARWRHWRPPSVSCVRRS